ncbi:alpha/beta hydrolase [Pedobacter aquatilis]|uniref:alpha/beta hydrolase family protein n=1 Tax=Pedobacter aquatilis TaxID=351343 RepID=UPI0025B4D8EB|nr:alpha/beta hydrolase [Pedobacter aquatilis]MDN3586605.1 alpha/beta hydrolase [Pedobacter aquatilis]
MSSTLAIVAQESNFKIRNIKFKSEGVSLAGTIFTPKKPYAAVIIVHGSGQEKRLIEFATKLASKGIIAFTYDKRGVGESGGVYAGPEVGTNNIDSANLNLLAVDASSATETLLANLPTKHLPIGLIGFSQAGWVIPLAAEKNHQINFMVLFSGPVVTAREQLRFQFFTQGNTNFWETHSESEIRSYILNAPDRYQFIDTDPRIALSKLSIQGLWIFGGKDIQIPTQLSIENIEHLKDEGKAYEYHLFNDLGHNTAPAGHSKPFEMVINWIKTKVAKK